MKKIYGFLMIAVLAIATFTLYSCGGDEEASYELNGKWTGTVTYSDGTKYDLYLNFNDKFAGVGTGRELIKNGSKTVSDRDFTYVINEEDEFTIQYSDDNTKFTMSYWKLDLNNFSANFTYSGRSVSWKCEKYNW